MSRQRYFKDRIHKIAEEKKSRIILALDLSESIPSDRSTWASYKDNLLKRAIKILNETSEYIVAVKINRQMILPLGLTDRIPELLDVAKDHDILKIMDAKINDVGHTNSWIAKHYFSLGFDAIIANPFVGWKGAMEHVFHEAGDHRGIILLTYMSHPGAVEGYGLSCSNDTAPKPLYHLFAERALSWNADGVIVGATHLDKLREISQILNGEVDIYSPGIGAQGGSLIDAFKNGCDFGIIGRSIYQSENPKQSALKFKVVTQKFFYS